MSAHPYQDPDSQSAEVLAAMIKRLEERGADPRFDGFIRDYLAEIRWSPGGTALDLGCGTGVVTRRLAETAPRDCRIFGVDLSAKLLAAARELTAGDSRIEWRQTNGAELPFSESSVDVIVMHTLLSHVPSPASILAEARRVLRRGGQLVVFDADFASNTFGLRDTEKGRRIDGALYSRIAAHLDLCRQLPRLFVEAGLSLRDHKGYVLSEAGRGDFWLKSVQGFAIMIPQLGILPADEGEEWVAEMLGSHAERSFFASGNFYTFFATKEAE